MVILENCKCEGLSFISIGRLAEDLGKEYSTIWRALKRLEDKKFIVVIHRHLDGKTNIYRLSAKLERYLLARHRADQQKLKGK